MNARSPLLPLLSLIIAGVALSATHVFAESPEVAPEQEAFFQQKVKPLLAARCFQCHGPSDVRKEKEIAGGLLLSSHESLIRGGDSGAAVVPGKPDESLLIEAVRWQSFEMPPTSKLPDGELAILVRWIEMGAPWPGSDASVEAHAPSEETFPLESRRASHWAWQPLADPEVPNAGDGWATTAIDRFIAQGYKQHGLHPAEDAQRQALVRRIYFDLVGLPPTPEEVRSFVDDPAPLDEAVSALVDRLLSSPHFGERWGRHWLDVMRYAETRGHEFDHLAANAWQYRDYVIRALNADVPYDQFVIEHLAGDLIRPMRLNPKEGFNESVLGTGFWFLGDWVHSPTDIRADETDRIDNMLDTVGRGFLGMTVACARCHDHKFDAISTADYYALGGFVQSSQYRQVRFESLQHNRELAEQLRQLRTDHDRAIRGRLAATVRPQVDNMETLLLAASEVVGGNSAGQVASQHDLDADQLSKWKAVLKRAADNAQHPMHTLARLAQANPEDRADIARELAVSLKQATTEKHVEASEANLLADAADSPAWPQDGFAFTPEAVRPGDLLWPDGSTLPRVALRSFYRHDEKWPELKVAPGTEAEPGGLAKQRRDGRTLRTPTFAIADDTISLLVRGEGHLQIVVASHRLIKGPLHGNLLRTFNTGGKLQWLTFPVKRYRAERAHFELVGIAGKPLEVYQLAQGTPPKIEAPAAPHVLAEFDTESKSIVASAAKAYGNALRKSVDHFSSPDTPTGNDASAHLLAWVLDNPELFGLDDATLKAELASMRKQFAEREAELLAQVQRESQTAPAIWDGIAENEYLLVRGNSRSPKHPVDRRFLEALGGLEHPIDNSGSGRLELARQIVDPKQNPLIARVIVNRVWHHLFGRGIVPTVDNFGATGEPPSHPELLDHLATEFIEDGWSIKRLIRRLATSRTYHMSSRPSETENERIDPTNTYLHRMRVRRLQAEAIRDAMLAISGELDPALGGPSVEVYLTPFMSGRGRPGKSGPLDGEGRRSVYLKIRRNFLSPMMLAFDAPVPTVPVGKRNVSNVPAQALILMNDPLVHQQAERWQQELIDIEEPRERIERMYLASFARPPTHEELAQGLQFLKLQAEELGLQGEAWKSDLRAWKDYGHALWNLKEFIYIR